MDFNALYIASTDRTDITVSGEAYSLKAWQGGSLKRVYVTRNGKSIGYFNADGEYIYEGRNFSPSLVQAWATSAANAVLGIEEAKPKSKPAATRLSFSNMSANSQPVELAHKAYKEAFEVYANNVDDSKWATVKDAYEAARVAYVKALNVQLAQEAIQAAQTVTAIIVASANQENEVGAISPDAVENGDSALSHALELRDMLYERFGVASGQADAQTMELWNKVDSAVAHADAGWEVCRPS